MQDDANFQPPDIGRPLAQICLNVAPGHRRVEREPFAVDSRCLLLGLYNFIRGSN